MICSVKEASEVSGTMIGELYLSTVLSKLIQKYQERKQDLYSCNVLSNVVEIDGNEGDDKFDPTESVQTYGVQVIDEEIHPKDYIKIWDESTDIRYKDIDTCTMISCVINTNTSKVCNVMVIYRRFHFKTNPLH